MTEELASPFRDIIMRGLLVTVPGLRATSTKKD